MQFMQWVKVSGLGVKLWKVWGTWRPCFMWHRGQTAFNGEFELSHQPLLALWTWADYVISLSLNNFTCKMGILAPTSTTGQCLYKRILCMWRFMPWFLHVLLLRSSKKFRLSNGSCLSFTFFSRHGLYHCLMCLPYPSFIDWKLLGGGNLCYSP